MSDNLKPGQTVRLTAHMPASDTGARWMAGRSVTIMEIDEGESWEPTIVKVECTNRGGRAEQMWINVADIALEL